MKTHENVKTINFYPSPNHNISGVRLQLDNLGF